MINFAPLFLFVNHAAEYLHQFGLQKVDGSELPVINFYIFDEVVNTRDVSFIQSDSLQIEAAEFIEFGPFGDKILTDIEVRQARHVHLSEDIDASEKVFPEPQLLQLLHLGLCEDLY